MQGYSFSKGVFSGSFARLHRYLPAGQSSMCNSTPPVDRRAKPCTRAKFRAKKKMIYQKIPRSKKRGSFFLRNPPSPEAMAGQAIVEDRRRRAVRPASSWDFRLRHATTP